MPKAYSADMRERVIARVASGTSRREAAEHYEIAQHSGHMDEVLSRDGTLCRETAGRQHLAAGGARGFFAGADCGAAGLDAGRGGVCDAQAKDVAVAPRCGVSSSATGSRLKKSLRAAEQERADVVRARRRWMREQGMFDPARLVFIDETAANTKMVRPSGVARAASGWWVVCRTATGRRSPLWALCDATG